MKLVFFFIALIGATIAYPETDLLQREEVRDDAGQYALKFLTTTGIAQAAQGSLQPNAAGTGNVLVTQGAYAFRTPEGRDFKVSYIADQNGFRAIGDHLPKPLA